MLCKEAARSNRHVEWLTNITIMLQNTAVIVLIRIQTFVDYNNAI
jgi:hypothetical protein